MLFRLALRNVFRARARSAITIGALFFGVAMSLLLSGFMLGVGESLVSETIESRVGSIQVHRAGYFEKRDLEPLAFNLETTDAFVSTLKSVAHVKAVTPRITFSGLLSNGSRGTIAVITAVDTSTVHQVLPRLDLYLEGKPLQPGDRNGAHVGLELTRALNLETGVPLMVQSKGLDGRDNALDLEPRGVMTGQNPLESKRSVTVPLAFAQSLLGMENKATEYVLAVDDVSKLDETAAALRVALGAGYEVQTWEQLRPGLRDLRLVQRAVLGGLSFVFLLIALFGVANTLLMSVLERTREIGTLLAVGMTRRSVAMLFVIEALLQSVIGSLAGLSVAVLVITLARHRGGFVISMGTGQGSFQVMPTLLPAVPVIVVLGACIGSVIAALSPAMRASRLRPVEALSSP